MFGALSILALARDGIGGSVDTITFNWSSLQIYLDLAIAIVVNLDAGLRGQARALEVVTAQPSTQPLPTNRVL